jgi:hypothetical protein
MDIALSEEAAKTGYLGRSDLAKGIPFKGQFDVEFELYGGLAYVMNKSDTTAALRNAMSRIRPSGTLYLAPLDKKARDALLPLTESIGQRGGRLERFAYHAEDEIWRLTLPPK